MKQNFDGRIMTISDWATAKQRERPLLPLSTVLAKGTRGAYQEWRKKYEAKYQKMLGHFPKQVPLRAKVLERKIFKKYLREKIIFNSERYMSVPAWICSPLSKKRGQKFPAIICCHGHGEGAGALVGLDLNGKPTLSYEKNLGIRLAEEGYVTISPYWRGFGVRTECPERHPRPRDLCNVGHLISEFLGYHLLTLDIWDGMKCLDYLESRSEVDATRMGCVGCSFGGTMTKFLTATDGRIKAACVSGSYFSLRSNSFPGWSCGSQTLPGLLYWGEGTLEIGGLISPRPLLIQIGQYDAMFEISKVLRSFSRLKKLYRILNSTEKIALDLFDGNHEIKVKPIIEWFDRWLK